MAVNKCKIFSVYRFFLLSKALHMVLLKWIPKENRMTGKSWLKHLQSDSDKFLEFQKILIEGIDTDEVVEHYSGSAEEYKELLNLYCLDGKRKLNVLKELLEEQDYKGYGIIFQNMFYHIGTFF